MTVLFDADLPVHYGFAFLAAIDDQPELMETRAGQRNGLCGAAVPGVLSMVTGLHTGQVPFVVEWHDTEPPLDAQWEDVVEVPFTASQPELALTSFDYQAELRLPAAGSLRARYCASGMDVGHAQDTSIDDDDAGDRYLLALWPAPPAPDVVVRQASACAAYWHREARAIRVPSAEERAAAATTTAERERIEAERAQAEAERQRWGGRRPTTRLRDLGGSVLSLARSDRSLLDAFAALDPETQRDAARWLARRAFQHAQIDQLDWVRPALAAMDCGDPLPPPFTDPAAVFDLVLPGGPRTLRVTVTRAYRATADAPPAGQPNGEIHRSAFAVPAIFSVVDPDPLRALVETYGHAAATFHDRRDDLRRELGRRYPALG